MQMVPRGLEPRTLRLLAVRSNQLSYETGGCPVEGCGILHCAALRRLQLVGQHWHACRWRPYRVEHTGSLPTSEVKRRRARLVLGWGTAREDLRVLPAFEKFTLLPKRNPPRPCGSVTGHRSPCTRPTCKVAPCTWPRLKCKVNTAYEAGVTLYD